MTLNEYQAKAEETDKASSLDYYYHGLASEAGELSAYRKRVLRGDTDAGNLIGELGDVLWYVAAVARHEGYTLEEVAQYNIDKLQRRERNGTVKGRGER